MIFYAFPSLENPFQKRVVLNYETKSKRHERNETKRNITQRKYTKMRNETQRNEIC